MNIPVCTFIPFDCRLRSCSCQSALGIGN